jgi:ATP-dependent Clp protease ATP-binding subunit ClpA
LIAVFERLDERSRHVIDLAQQQARALGHNYLGTEHLLYGLTLGGGNIAALLARRNCGPNDVTKEIVTIIGRGRLPARQPDTLLATLGIDLDQVRQRAEATFGTAAMTRVALRARPRRRWRPGQRWWPGCEHDRPPPSALLGTQWLGLAPRVKKVLDIAVRHSTPRQVSPEQLTHAILEEGRGVACQILTRRDVDLAELATALQDTDEGT